MKATYDQRDIKVTPRFKNALIELMKAQCEMMAENEPDFAECWTWGRVEIGDIATYQGLSFEFGGDEDKPKGHRFTVS